MRATDRVLVHAQRGVYVEVRSHESLAPPEVHDAERRVALRRQRLRHDTNIVAFEIAEDARDSCVLLR